jgi:hypothetical protein
MNTSYRNFTMPAISILVGCALSYLSMLGQFREYMTLSKGGANDGNIAHHKGEAYHKEDGLCQRLEGKSAPSLWASSKSDLLQASLHPFDPNGYHKEWMSALLQQLSTSDLHKGLLHPPSGYDLHRVMQKIEARMAEGSSAPVVQVGVFGGSITQGSGCDFLPYELKPFFKDKTEAAPNISGRGCAWPTRLQLLCDYFLGKNVVQVTNLGAGGATSDLSIPLLKYRLFGNEDLTKHGFDIIINGHGVNDNDFKRRGSLVLDNFNTAMQVAEAFYRQARTSRPCDIDNPPLVLFLNEYMGNTNEIIVGENLRHSAVKLVSEYYEFMYVSYTHVFQRFVYQRSNETIFSPPKWGTMIYWHFGMTGHVLLPWVMAYSALQSVVDYCNHQQATEQEEWNLDKKNSESNSHRQESLIPDTAKDPVLVKSLPPLLNNAAWKTISETWKNDAEEYKKQVHDYCALGENATGNPCPFAFMSSFIGTYRDAASLNEYLAPYTFSQQGEMTPGWQGADDFRDGWHNKNGVVPTKGVGSKITLRVSNLTAPVRHVTIETMKSYGPDWDASIANFKLSVLDDGEKPEYETSFNLTGWHDKRTSIAYVYEFDLDTSNTLAQAGKSIELEITLLQGIKFKIMAILMCSQ